MTYVNNLSARSLQILLLLFLDKRDDFADTNEEFYSPSINKILVTINGDAHHLFKGGLGAMDIYPELKNIFTKNTLMSNGNSFWPQNLLYGLIHVQVLLTLFMAVAEQWIKV